MFGYHTLWRRKKMRFFIVGCLGICAVLSLIMVTGSVDSTRTLVPENHSRIRGYRAVTSTSVLRIALGGGVKELHGNGYHGNGKDDDGMRSRVVGGSPYNNVNDDNYAGDDAYYNNEPDDNNNDNNNIAVNSLLNVKKREEEQGKGFVIEDNAADYNKDYDDEEDETYQQEGYEDDYVNPPFKPGDFDYSLWNKTKQPAKLKLEEVRRQENHGDILSLNGSHVYNAVQYKGMHLLENKVERPGYRSQKNNSQGNGSKHSKDGNLEAVGTKQMVNRKFMDGEQERMHPLRSNTNQNVPCIAGSNCHLLQNQQNDQNDNIRTKINISQHRKNSQKKSLNVHHTDENALLFHKMKSGSQNPVNTAQRAHLPNINNQFQSQPNYQNKQMDNTRIKYGDVSESKGLTDQNIVAGQWIETQIPIQDGGVDANWLLQEQPATQIQMPELPWQPGEVRSPEGIPLIVDKIFWSKEVEDLIPKGVMPEDFQHFLHKLYTTPVHQMSPPQWNRCGRPRNQYVVLTDGTALCARYREEHVKLLHGEILSFYFSRILGLDNVPVVALSEARSDAPQWQGMNLSAARWNESSIVALTEWVDGLESERSRVKMPYAILEAFENGSVFDHHHRGVHHLTANNLTELLQWSDMILFDYLTGHYDRVASMQDGADREQKPSIMHENIRNLRKVWQTSKMWLIDNESGLFDGYELLYHGGEMGRKFVEFHIQMLRTNCIFRRETVQKIFQLASLSSPHDELVRYAKAQDPLYERLPYAKEVLLFQKYFPVRLKEVVDWIKKCQAR